jgi:hypothetical protein
MTFPVVIENIIYTYEHQLRYTKVIAEYNKLKKEYMTENPIFPLINYNHDDCDYEYEYDYDYDNDLIPMEFNPSEFIDRLVFSNKIDKLIA